MLLEYTLNALLDGLIIRSDSVDKPNDQLRLAELE
jgi:hypothetical protein